MLLAWLSFIAAVPQSPDLTLTWVRSGGDVSATTLTVSISGQKVRVESTAPRAPVLLWDGASNQLVMLRPHDPTAERRTDTFTRLDEASARQLRARQNPQLDEARQAIEQSASRLSAQRQAQLKAGLDTITAPTQAAATTFTSKHQRVTTGRWPCERYQARREAVEFEVCLVPWKQAPVRAAELEPLRALSAFLAVLNGPPLPDEVVQAPSAESPGLAVSTTVPLAGTQARSVELRAATHGPVAPDLFAVPAGFVEAR
jgi:hypothetical protein